MIGSFEEKLKRRTLYSHAGTDDGDRTILEYMTVHFSRFDKSGWEREILAGNVTLNGQGCIPSSRLKRHDLIVFYPVEEPEPEAELSFRTVFEDDDLIVFDKPGGLCVHPTGPFFRNTLWYLAGKQYGEIRFVNRLDRETSGLLAGAKNPETAAALDNGKTVFHKEYLALVIGRFQGESLAEGCLVPDPESPVPKKKWFIPGRKDIPHGENAVTLLREEAFIAPDMTLVRAIPKTGRQHQIRATLFSLGFPLVGDKLYGLDESIFLRIRERKVTEQDLDLLRMDRQALHSALLEFRHPKTGKMIRCTSSVDFRSMLRGITPSFSGQDCRRDHHRKDTL